MAMSAEELAWLNVALGLIVFFIAGPLVVWIARRLRRIYKANQAKRLPPWLIPRGPLRERFWFWMYKTTQWGRIIDLTQMILSAVSCVTYVIEQYDEEMKAATWSWVFDLAITVFFTFYFFMQLMLATAKIRYLFSFMGMADLFTILPVYILAPYRDDLADGNSASGLTFLRFLRLLRVYRVVRSLRLVRAAPDAGVQRQVFLVAFSTISIVFCSAAVLHIVENNFGLGLDENGDPTTGEEFEFHQYVYFSMISVLGRPNVPIRTVPGYLTMMATICIAVVIIPAHIAKLVEYMRRDTRYMRRECYPSESQIHLVLTGDGVTTLSASIFLGELFHESRNTMYEPYLAILASEPPDSRMEELLGAANMSTRATYLQGDALIDDDMARTNVDRMLGCFIMSRKYSCAPEDDDRRTISKALSVMRHNTSTRLFVQVLRPNSKQALIGMPSWSPDTDFCLCIDEFKGNILGKTALCPGLATMVANLLATRMDPEASVMAKWPSWQREYAQGMSNQIYPFVIPAKLHGCNFSEAARILYTEFAADGGPTLLAVSGRNRIVLNPGRYRILQEGELAFLIAEDEGVAQRVSAWGTDWNKAKTVQFDFLAARSTGRDCMDNGTPTPHTPFDITIGEDLDAPAEILDPYLPSVTPTVVDPTILWPNALGQLSTTNPNPDRASGKDTPTPEGMMSPGPRERKQAQAQIVAKLMTKWRDRASTPQADDIAEASDDQKNHEVVRDIAEAVYQGDLTAMLKDVANLAGLHLDTATSPVSPLTSPASIQDIVGARVARKSVTFETANVSAEISSPYLVEVTSPRPGVSAKAGKPFSVSQLSQHILICGFSSGAMHVVTALRRRANRSRRIPVVLLFKGDLPQDVIGEHAEFLDMVYHLNGSPTSYDDLCAAGLHRAAAAIIVSAPPSKSTQRDANGEMDTTEEVLIDVDAMLCAFKISREAPSLFVVTELLHSDNAKFFQLNRKKDAQPLNQPCENDGEARNETDWWMRPEYASGSIYGATMLDLLLVQFFYNPHIQEVVNGLVAVTVEEPIESKVPDVSTTRPSPLFYLGKVPDSLIGHTFQELFVKMASDRAGTIPMGLYRASGCKDNSTPYVYTTPRPDTRLVKGDRVYLLQAPRRGRKREVPNIAAEATEQGVANEGFTLGSPQILKRKGARMEKPPKTDSGAGVVSGAGTGAVEPTDVTSSQSPLASTMDASSSFTHAPCGSGVIFGAPQFQDPSSVQVEMVDMRAAGSDLTGSGASARHRTGSGSSRRSASGSPSTSVPMITLRPQPGEKHSLSKVHSSPSDRSIEPAFVMQAPTLVLTPASGSAAGTPSDWPVTNT